MTGGRDLLQWREARRKEPLTFTLDGQEITVGEHPARVWVLALLSDESVDLLLDVIDPDVAQDLWDDTMDPDCDITAELLDDIGRALLGKVAGRPWWEVSRLVATLVDRWTELNGRAADRGLGDPLDWPLDRLCDWTYARLIDGATGERRAAIDRELTDSPIVVDPEDDPGWADEASGWSELAAFVGSPTA